MKLHHDPLLTHSVLELYVRSFQQNFLHLQAQNCSIEVDIGIDQPTVVDPAIEELEAGAGADEVAYTVVDVAAAVVVVLVIVASHGAPVEHHTQSAEHEPSEAEPEIELDFVVPNSSDQWAERWKVVRWQGVDGVHGRHSRLHLLYRGLHVRSVFAFALRPLSAIHVLLFLRRVSSVVLIWFTGEGRVTSDFSGLFCQLFNLFSTYDTQDDHIVVSFFKSFVGTFEGLGIDEDTTDLGPSGT